MEVSWVSDGLVEERSRKKGRDAPGIKLHILHVVCMEEDRQRPHRREGCVIGLEVAKLLQGLPHFSEDIFGFRVVVASSESCFEGFCKAWGTEGNWKSAGLDARKRAALLITCIWYQSHRVNTALLQLQMVLQKV